MLDTERRTVDDPLQPAVHVLNERSVAVHLRIATRDESGTPVGTYLGTFVEWTSSVMVIRHSDNYVVIPADNIASVETAQGV